MNVNATSALLPVQIVRQPVKAFEQRGILNHRQNRPLREKQVPAEKSQHTMKDNYAPYDHGLRVPPLKGEMVDVYA